MDLKKLILTKVKKRGWVKSSEIVERSGFSRAYIGRFFHALIKENKLLLVGKANRARYVLPDRKIARPSSIVKILKNQGLEEDRVLAEIENETSVFSVVSVNARNLLSYGFSEMLNNAIEHSRSKIIKVDFSAVGETIMFEVRDQGVGVFKNVQKKFRLKNEPQAINHLLKGKQTTAPRAHSGEGIFFTSKAADCFIIDSFGKRLIVDNLKNDIFIKNIKPLKGTRIRFLISPKTKRLLKNIFSEFTGHGFKFEKTRVWVKLGMIDNEFLSRSQARRIIFGLDEFKEIILDFKDVDGVGQSFTDEIFRVWHSQHRRIKITIKNAQENVLLMVARAKD